MSDKTCFPWKGGVIFLFLCASAFFPLAGAPRRSYDDGDNSLREMRDSIDSLRHEVENHEIEIRMSEQRVENQEGTISSLRQQVLDAAQANKDIVRGAAANTEARISSLEAANKGLVADLKQLKTHANESSEALTQYKQHIGELEKMIQMQGQNIDNLQAALRSLTDVLQVKEGSSAVADSGKTYRIKSGDSLEKIAKAHGTTVKALKEMNNLTNDRIIVGQSLQLP